MRTSILSWTFVAAMAASFGPRATSAFAVGPASASPSSVRAAFADKHQSNNWNEIVNGVNDVNHHRALCVLSAEGDSSEKIESADSIVRVSEEESDVPIPFLDISGSSFIECYTDSVATVDGVKYTIGVPCDYTVALCYYEGDTLVPIDLNDSLMDDVFPIAENIIAEEYDEEWELQRTPQTLTLIGDLEDDEDEDDDDEDDDEIDDDGEDGDSKDGEEDVELILTFEHRDREFHLVRLLDPILLVGKEDAERPGVKVLLTPEESDQIMPVLEGMFLELNEDSDGTLL